MSSKNSKKRQRKKRLLIATIIALIAVIIALGVMIGISVRKSNIQAQEASASAAAEAEKSASEAAEAEASSKAAEEEASAKAEQEETQKLLEEQTKEANKETSEVIKGIALLGTANVSAKLNSSVVTPDSTTSGGHVVCIDAGHETGVLTDTEPNGPGSSEMKQKVSSGTYGEASGLWEYQLNLTVALKVQSILESRGYTVIMTRTTNDVQMSNIDRAEFANSSGAEIMVRIHANSVENTDVKGALCFGPARDNPYLSSDLIEKSLKLSQNIVDSFCAATGAQNRGVDDTNTLTGLNWTTIPCTYVEMGFMSNTEEDLLMATDDYQNKMAEGIANGIDAYFAG